jgi:hypothetical protein
MLCGTQPLKKSLNIRYVTHTRSIRDNLLLHFSPCEKYSSVPFLTHRSASPHSHFRYSFLTNSVTVQKCAQQIIIRYFRPIKITYYRNDIYIPYNVTESTVISIRTHWNASTSVRTDMRTSKPATNTKDRSLLWAVGRPWVPTQEIQH